MRKIGNPAPCCCGCELCVILYSAIGEEPTGAGAAVRISHGDGEEEVTDAEGTTGEDGRFCWSGASEGVTYHVRITALSGGECTVTTDVVGCVEVPVYYCEASVFLECVDHESGSSIDLVESDIGLSLSNAECVSDVGHDIPHYTGCSVLTAEDPIGLYDSIDGGGVPYTVEVSGGFARLHFCGLKVGSNWGVPFKWTGIVTPSSGDYYPACYCFDFACAEQTIQLRFWPVADFIMVPCCFNCCGAEDHINAIDPDDAFPTGNMLPKTLYGTFTGPDYAFGAWSGTPVELTYLGATVDGGGSIHHRWDSGCLPGGGAKGQCYNSNTLTCPVWGYDSTIPGCVENAIIQGPYPIPCEDYLYPSARMWYEVVQGGSCSATLNFHFFWNDSCPAPDTPPDCHAINSECDAFADATPPFRPFGMPMCTPAGEHPAPSPCEAHTNVDCPIPSDYAPNSFTVDADFCMPLMRAYESVLFDLYGDPTTIPGCEAVTITGAVTA